MRCGWIPTVVAALCLAASADSQTNAPPPAERPRGEFFHALPPEQQERFFALLNDWMKLPANQRTALLDKFSETHRLNADQRARLEQSLKRFEQMSPETRERIHERVRRWRAMTPEQREQFHQRELRMRAKADQELKEKLDDLGVQPSTEQMRWIRQYYFRKRAEIERQVAQRGRELKAQLHADASDADKQNIRAELQSMRKDLEEKAGPEFEEFARHPRPLPPPEDFGGGSPHRK